MKSLVALSFLIFSTLPVQASRGELERYRLLHDRFSIDRYLKYQNPFLEKIFSLDFAGSSGLKDLLGDVSTATDTGTSTEQETEVTQILIKNANTEKFLNARIDLMAPLPSFNVKGLQFYPQIFTRADVGLSFSVSNLEDPANPEASLYARKDFLGGVHLWFEAKKGETWKTSLYYMQRSDLIETVTASDIAGDGNIVELSDLDKNENTLRTDIAFHKNKSSYHYLIELKEIPLKRLSDHKANFQRTPLFHTQYTWKNPVKVFNFSPFVGFHFRNHYAISEGLYLGGHLNFSDSPFTVLGKLSQDFITLTPRYEHGFLHFSYALKSPLRNPQDDLWVSAIHNINLSILF